MQQQNYQNIALVADYQNIAWQGYHSGESRQ